ncbi:hypothetical protein HPP92_022776 [Vanilla planifolia]|uniref:Uncharacterized protein n=1 Tax=Vanilla planifolia TaxID=51239 RepID=A0A835PYX8_VANPL|nr:hypothetical protein HPP92_022776 [Vanilla planifolia]
MTQAKINAFFKPSQSKEHYQIARDNKACYPLLGEKDVHSPSKFACQDSMSNPNRDGDDCQTSQNVRKVNGAHNSSNSNLTKKRSYEQYHLNFGQIDFILHTCSMCGLMYACGVEEDEQFHRKFHHNYFMGIQIKGWKNERVISCLESNRDRILLVLDNDPPAHKRMVQKFVKIMEKELGFADDHVVHANCKVYLYVSGHRIVGCLIAEPIRVARRIISSYSSSSTCCNDNTVHATDVNISRKCLKKSECTLQFGDFSFRRESVKRTCPSSNGNLDSGAVICEEQAVPAKCGIRAIWVVPSCRRNKIASQLIDAARTSFSPGQMMEISECAFSPPTSAGKAFATCYTGSREFLVYREDDV